MTLLEIIIVIVILTILYSISVPNFSKMAEKNKGENASFSLVAVANAEKRYKLDKAQYYLCAAPCNITTLNNELGVLINDSYFDYKIVGNTTVFEAIATRKGSEVCGGKTMKVTNENSTAVKGCDLW